MATQEELYNALRKADAAGDTEGARKLAAYIQSTQVAGGGGPAPEKPRGVIDQVKQQAGNVLAGAVRGAGSIGATILAPYDMATDALAGKGLSLESNRERRAAMDAGLQSMGAQPDSFAYGAGKLAGEIAGTAGTGGVLARGAAMVPGVSANALAAIGSAGMNAGTATGVGNALLRAGGGALTGGAAAGLVDPSQAGTGAIIGGALPGAMQVAGAAGNAIGRTLRGPIQDDATRAAVGAARGSGYVIPPSQARPSLGNRLLEGFSGKITTAQNASAKNQVVTNSKAATAIGLPADAQITPEVLDAVREEAGTVYRELASLAPRPATAADTLTNRAASEAIDPAAMVFDLRKARNDATAWYRSYGRTADPDSLVKAKEAKAVATRLEKTLEDYASSLGRDDLVPAMREARQLIAKTYSIEGALNTATGTIDARKLAGQLQKGRPLSGELREAAEFAGRFPKAAQTVEQMGSLPQTSPLDWMAAGGLSAVTSNPLLMATAMARPVARAAVLSPVVQNRLIQQPNALAQLLGQVPVNELAYRSAPVALSGR